MCDCDHNWPVLAGQAPATQSPSLGRARPSPAWPDHGTVSYAKDLITLALLLLALPWFLHRLVRNPAAASRAAAGKAP